MSGPSYYELNKELFKKNLVRYSWRPQGLDEIEAFLKDGRYRTEKITRHLWDTTWYVRDGSFLVLEDTLVVYKGDRKVGDITGSKAFISKEIGDERLFNFIKERYGKPISARTAAFVFFTLTLFAITLLFARPDRDFFEILRGLIRI
jgi:hypothetical protein